MGVIIASIRIVNNKPIVIKGIKTLRFRNPGIAKTRRVISKLVNEIVVLTPAKTTELIKISCVPKPVYLMFEENGVIKVHPAAVNVRFEHFVTYVFFRLLFTTLFATNHKDSG
jgi:hypothetical protein